MRERTQRFDPRQVMHRGDFEVFHYRDPQTANVQLHHHDFYEVYFFLGQGMDYRVEGRIHHLSAGDLLLLSPMEFHQPIVKSENADLERIVLWIDKSFLEGLSQKEFPLTRCFSTARESHANLLRLSPAQRADITEKLGELIHEYYNGGDGAELCATGIFLQFMVMLNRIALKSAPKPDGQESSALISKVLSYIAEHYSEDLSLDTLAQKFYVSKYHLSHEFSRIVGTSVYRYVMLKRLQTAKQMLSEGASPGAVSLACGFGDYANFFRAFKMQYGIAPRQCAPERK